MINLLLNAIDAVADMPPPRGRVLVRTRPAEVGVEVCIEDHGEGIPAKYEARLFESFFTTKPHGVGLGLSIVRSILDAHAGHIHAANHAQGAAFTFTLPTIDSGARAAAAAAPPALQVTT